MIPKVYCTDCQDVLYDFDIAKGTCTKCLQLKQGRVIGGDGRLVLNNEGAQHGQWERPESITGCGVNALLDVIYLHDEGNYAMVLRERCKDVVQYKLVGWRFTNNPHADEKSLVLDIPYRPPESWFIDRNSKPEMVNHPKHYNKHGSGIECIDVIEWFNLNLGNVIKYIWRAEEKGAPIQDLEKAAWYLNREIERRKKLEA